MVLKSQAISNERLLKAKAFCRFKTQSLFHAVPPNKVHFVNDQGKKFEMLDTEVKGYQKFEKMLKEKKKKSKKNMNILGIQ